MIRRSVSASLDYEINANHKLYFKSIYNHRDDWENRFRLTYGDIYEPNANGLSEAGEVVRKVKGGLGSDRIKNRRLEDQRTYNFSLSGNHLIGGLLTSNWSATIAKASETRPHERYIEYVSLEFIPFYSTTILFTCTASLWTIFK